MNLQSEQKLLQRVRDSLEKKISILTKKVEKRKEYFESRSESWQESMAGSIYDDKTFEIEHDINSIEIVFREVDELIPVCKLDESP